MNITDYYYKLVRISIGISSRVKILNIFLKKHGDENGECTLVFVKWLQVTLFH